MISLEDRLAADVFQRSYRRFLEIKSTHYRWSHLAPQSVGHLQEACDKHWSVEKLADYLHCDAAEAEACLRRFNMSKKVNAKDTTAGRLRQAVFEWIGEVADLEESAKRKLADELAKMVGNQLFVAAQAKEDLLKLSLELEGKEEESAAKKPVKGMPKVSGEASDTDGKGDGAASKWGPQWKD